MATFGNTSTTPDNQTQQATGFMGCYAATLSDSNAVVSKLTGNILKVVGGPQLMRAVIYANNAGAPGAFVAVTAEVNIPAQTPNTMGSFDFAFGSPPTLAAGTYYLGYWFGTGNNGCVPQYNTGATLNYRASQTYASTGNPPNDPFGTPTTVANFMFELYATYTVAAPPVNTVAPVASGSTTIGSVVSTTDGTWTGSPTFTYQWQRDVLGNGVYSNIALATSNTYTLVLLDDACNIRCTVTGTNASGSASANSNSILDTTPVPSGGGINMMLLGVGGNA